MACQAMHMWSMSGLVAAFLDLAIAYLLLCASAVAFFASKFLGFFGLNLPCPCDGMFFDIPIKDYCLNRLLVDFPTQQVSNVQLSVKQKFPFNDSTWARNQNYNFGEDNYVNGILEIEGDASCSSVSNARRSGNVVRRDFGSWDEKYDVKGKGVVHGIRSMNYRSRSRLHRRRKGSGDHGKYSSVSSYDPSIHEEILGSIPYSHSSSNKGGNGTTGGSLLRADYGIDAYHIEYNKKVPSIKGMRQSALSSVQMNNSSDEDMHINKNVLSIEELQEVQSFSGKEKNAIRLLEQALEEEHSACDALCIELEKERSAAASAADEAMAMILRLHEEKASIEMEARQYQRMIEEKTAYDAEEMNILKEILIRREMEKHFLEKEVEAYQMVSLGNQQLEGDGSDNSDDRQQIFGLSIDPNDDPVLMLHQLSASTDKKVTAENRCSDGFVSMVKPNCKVALDLQEKEMISVDSNSYLTPKGPQEFNFLDKIIPLKGQELDQHNEGMNLGGKLDENNTVTGNGDETKDAHLEFCNSGDLTFDNDSRVYDVHVIGDGISFCDKANISKSEQRSVSGSSKVNDKNSVPVEASVMKSIHIITDCPSTSVVHAEVDIKRSSSDISSGLPPMVPRGTSLLSDLRRKSISTVDNEMLKINGEVGRLRERLRSVQEGREKLSFSVENWERENLQLKLLDDIARQVQEIRHLTEPGKAIRQVSLPLPTSKVLSKKKRCRSVSSGLQRSS